MGYQALLFCPDEKLARVVSQVFTELDFAVEPVHEPFAAVKKLMTQRYDAIVVDCENEQNASLLFKSARNSSSNQSSLAIALVLGQAGVAKSYRIGANLVLTKPINVEQAKGTLRVARGLLRKNADAAGTGAPPQATPARTAPASAGTSPASRGAAEPASPISSEFEIEDPLSPAIPAIAASAQVESEPELIPAHAAQPELIAVESPEETWEPAVTQLDVTKHDAVSNYDAAAVSAPAQNSGSAFTPARRSAAAPAPAREVTAPPAKEKGPKVAASGSSTPSHGAASTSTSTSMSGYVGNAPSFSAFSEEASGGSGVKKKVLIAAVVLLALAALGYVGYGKFAKPSLAPVPQSISAPSRPQSSAPPAVVAPSVAPSTSTADLAGAPTSALAPKTTAATPLDK